MRYDGEDMTDARKDIAVIGAGAAGFAAAIVAARRGAQVTLYEATGRVAQSIKVTGDGRCNIANTTTAARDYRNSDFVEQAFRACPPHDALVFLESCGLLLREEAQGRLYPQANKSTSVIDALRLAAQRAGVGEACGKRAVNVRRSGSRWTVSFADTSSVEADAVIVSCGGNVPSDLLDPSIAIEPIRPILGPLATDARPLRGLDKVRAKCALTCNGVREDGEVTFRGYGLSGIAAFNASRRVHPGDVLTIDFLPSFAADESLAYLQHRMDGLQPRTWLELTCGMLLPLIARAVLRAAALPDEGAPTRENLLRFDAKLRAFPLTVSGIGDAKLCQVHRGGIAVACVDARSLQVREHSGLYATGEALDVDGPCGGYNLQWAWVSGMIAGAHAAGARAEGPR